MIIVSTEFKSTSCIGRHRLFGTQWHWIPSILKSLEIEYIIVDKIIIIGSFFHQDAKFSSAKLSSGNPITAQNGNTRSILDGNGVVFQDADPQYCRRRGSLFLGTCHHHAPPLLGIAAGTEPIYPGLSRNERGLSQLHFAVRLMRSWGRALWPSNRKAFMLQRIPACQGLLSESPGLLGRFWTPFIPQGQRTMIGAACLEPFCKSFQLRWLLQSNNWYDISVHTMQHVTLHKERHKATLHRAARMNEHANILHSTTHYLISVTLHNFSQISKLLSGWCYVFTMLPSRIWTWLFFIEKYVRTPMLTHHQSLLQEFSIFVVWYW